MTKARASRLRSQHTSDISHPKKRHLRNYRQIKFRNSNSSLRYKAELTFHAQQGSTRDASAAQQMSRKHRSTRPRGQQHRSRAGSTSLALSLREPTVHPAALQRQTSPAQTHRNTSLRPHAAHSTKLGNSHATNPLASARHCHTAALDANVKLPR